MAGVTINITAHDEALRAALRKLSGAVLDLRPAFQDIGNKLITIHHERFRAQRSPDGTPWAPLSPAYRARKAKNKDLILVLRGYLRDMPRYQVSATALEFGIDRIYGATHQFGDPSRHIPARPFLGLSPADRTTVLGILNRHLAAALR